MAAGEGHLHSTHLVRAALLSVAMVQTVSGAARADGMPIAYLAETCHACHGKGAGQGIPALTSLAAPQIAEAVRAYRDGTRKNAVMNAAASGLDDGTIRELAAYLASNR